MFLDESAQKQADACVTFYRSIEKLPVDVKNKLLEFIAKLQESTRSSGKRCKERRLEEALEKLRAACELDCCSLLQVRHVLPLVRLVLAFQLETLGNSTAFRKLDQMMIKLSEINQTLVFEEVQKCLRSTVDKDEILSFKDLQIVSMFLEDSSVGRQLFRQAFPSLLSKVAETFPVIMDQEAARNGEWCYLTVKVCLQIFQLLPTGYNESNAATEVILQHLLLIILGQSSNRDTRLLAGTASTMAINTAPQPLDGVEAVLSFLEVASTGPSRLCTGSVTVACGVPSRDGVNTLAVTRGLLTCCRKDILLSPMDREGTCLLLDGVFPVVSALCEESLDCHYYIFQVLALWLKCVRENLEEVWAVTGVPLLSDRYRLKQRLTQLIWNSAESPVEGVSEFVHSLFRLLLEIYELECERFQDPERPLYMSLLHRVTALPWEAKSKYFPLCALLPYIGTDKVLEHFPMLPCHLLSCLSTNHLSPCASEAYKCIIKHQRRELCARAALSETELAEQWARWWYPTLLEALTSDVTLLQNNACSYLLPWTLRTFPAAFELLQHQVCLSGPRQLRAWASILGAQRTVTGSSPLQSSQLGPLRLSLGSLDDSVRLAALSLLCCSPKTNQPPTELELAEMRAFIPLNLNCDSSPFRQHLQAGVKKFLVRIRDSCLACLRARKGKIEGEQEEKNSLVAQGVAFVDWLAQLPFYYLAPGLTYQRKKTALLLLSAVLETCTDSWSPDKKKGQPPVNMSALIGWARQRGQWDFFSRTNLLVLLRCLEDGTNEIRDLGSELLLRFFPPLLPQDLRPGLFERAQKLICCPRVQDAQAGALMMKMVLQTSEDLSSILKIDCKAESDQVPMQDVNTVSLVLFLLQELQQHHLAAEEDMLNAARTKPIHGVLVALQRCLLDVPNAWISMQTADISPRGSEVIPRLVETLEKISMFLLGVLYGNQGGSCEEQETPPSFCDMGNAINWVIAQGGGLADGEGDDCVLLSEEHSLIMTCCWVSLKEIGIFLGSLVEKVFLVAPSGAATQSLLTIEDLKKIAKVFKDILLKCRHWGAVEGCCAGFTKFCAVLLNNPNPELQAIPTSMLEQGLLVLQTPRSTSVTRRAAGLPMLILCIVAAENASKARPLLAHSMKTLLDTARAPLPLHWDQTLDLPQVCAVHALQAVVRCSGLGVAVLQFAPAMTMLSLNALSSPCWAMRNAALQLFSSLCSRMLGQRPSGGDGSVRHTMSPPAFFTNYPALQAFLLGQLEGAAESLGSPGEGRLHLHPSLHSVLALLAKLQPGVHDETGSLSTFQAPLLQLAASPVYAMREMASKALLAMTPPSEYMSTLLQLAGELPETRVPFCHNRLHGQLLQIRALLGRTLGTDGLAVDTVNVLVEKFESRLWLITSTPKCPLIGSAYLCVAAQLARFCTRSFLDQLHTSLMMELHGPRNRLQVGLAVFSQNAVRFLCDEAVRAGDPEMGEQVWRLLSVGDPDVQLALVRWAGDGQSWKDTDLQPVLDKALRDNLKALLERGSVEYRRAYLEAFVAVVTTGADSPDPQAALPPGPTQWICTELLLDLLESRSGGPELLSQLLCAVGLLLSDSPADSLTERWCGLLETHRTPETSDSLRLGCAKALRLGGAPLVRRALAGRAPCPALCARTRISR
ncbi:tRNA (32-2'-O)-methyltransferase regulator THADA isoform X2 [Amia ocellicauda]|uniref:tRNA (32-2'-O)-methyltransferase regulator THADA isoform X2 n=1 Tax=Amia ocellicauda TaxID=2972642 RepID=UPI00346417E3